MAEAVRLLTNEELEKYLRCSRVKIKRLRDQCGLPFIILGKRRYYDINAVNQWLEKQQQVHCENQGA